MVPFLALLSAHKLTFILLNSLFSVRKCFLQPSLSSTCLYQGENVGNQKCGCGLLQQSAWFMCNDVTQAGYGSAKDGVIAKPMVTVVITVHWNFFEYSQAQQCHSTVRLL